jgi:hypothetical protein
LEFPAAAVKARPGQLLAIRTLHIDGLLVHKLKHMLVASSQRFTDSPSREYLLWRSRGALSILSVQGWNGDLYLAN